MRLPLAFAVLIGLAGFALAADEPDWSINSTTFDACSCNMLCPCYFTGSPAPGGGGAMHHHGNGENGGAYCRFNDVFKVNSGHWGDTKLDGIKFWLAGDLGGDFAKGFDWAVITFEPDATPQQREAITAIVHHVFPGKFNSFTEGQAAKIDWSLDKDKGVAKLDDGKAAEVVLQRNPGMTDEPIVLSNAHFWAAPRNEGFKMMQNQVQAYKLGDKGFETKGTSGFVVTFDMNSKDVAAAAEKK